jgi:hypothetical protein
MWPWQFFADDPQPKSITPIVFGLIILLFGSDSAGQVKTAGNNYG